MKRAFTLIELALVIVVLFMIFGVAYFMTNYLLEKSRMKSLNISANNIKKAMQTYQNTNRVPNGITVYDLLKDNEAKQYVTLNNDPWNNKFKKVQSIVYRDGRYSEINIYLHLINKGCFYLLDGTTEIIPYTCDLDLTKHGLYTKVHIKNLEKSWQTSDISIMVSTQEYIKGLPLKRGGTGVCYRDNETLEKCIDTDKRGKATITIKQDGLHKLNIYSKNKDGYSVDKDTLFYNLKIDKTLPTVTINPNEKPLVCAINNKVDTEININPIISPSGVNYRYRLANNGIWGKWSPLQTLSTKIILKELGRIQIQVESNNGAGKSNTQLSGYYLLEGPLVKITHTPSSITIPYSGSQKLNLTYQCISGIYGLTNCAYKFSNELGTTNQFINNYVMTLKASKTITVKKATYDPDNYLWIKPVSNSDCSKDNFLIKTHVFE